MYRPRISIITACRNSADTIEDTIRCVADQGYEDVEHIIVDAESTDGTTELLRRHRESISIWIREPDDGIADAWNKGIGRATGEIIGILNADDFYTPETIPAIVDAFAANRECGFVFGDIEMRNGATGRSYKVFGRQDYESITRYDMLLPHPTMFVRKWVYDRVGLFDTGYRVCADYEFVRRMMSRGVKGLYLPRLAAVMREGGLSERDRISAAREVMDISTKYGAKPALARCYFCVKCLRFYFGKAISRLGLSLSTQRRLLHGTHRSDS